MEWAVTQNYLQALRGQPVDSRVIGRIDRNEAKQQRAKYGNHGTYRFQDLYRGHNLASLLLCIVTANSRHAVLFSPTDIREYPGRTALVMASSHRAARRSRGDAVNQDGVSNFTKHQSLLLIL
jgi:hypothetical protein